MSPIKLFESKKYGLFGLKKSRNGTFQSRM